MTKSLFVLSSRFTNQEAFLRKCLTLSKKQECNIWANVELDSRFYAHNLNISGPKSEHKVKTSAISRLIAKPKTKSIRSIPLRIFKAIYKLFWIPFEVSWKLNVGKNKIVPHEYSELVAADQQAVLALWFYKFKDKTVKLSID